MSGHRRAQGDSSCTSQTALAASELQGRALCHALRTPRRS